VALPAEPANVYASCWRRDRRYRGRKICNALVPRWTPADSRRRIWHITSGDDLAGVREFIPADGRDYTAADVIDRLLAGVSGMAGAPA
jgi:hypothetical protein